MRGILSYGAYIPFHRLDRTVIDAALGTTGSRGARAVASFDEDTTTLGVEAARWALRDRTDLRPDTLLFATTIPAYADKTNATAIHAALGLDPATAAFDMVGAVRSGSGALRQALEGPRTTLTVASDIRIGLPGGSDERDGGDAAAAFVTGAASTAPVIAEYLGAASATAEFLDRWRNPGDPASHTWEERFGEQVYVALANRALADALKHCDIAPAGIDHLIVAGLHRWAARRVAASIGAPPAASVDDLSAAVGNPGAAQAGLLLASVLDQAEAGAVIALTVLADGADVVLLRATDALAAHRPALAVADQVAAGRPLGYQTYLTWRGLLRRDPPRRPDPVPPGAPNALRASDWKYAFTAGRCQTCGTRHLPPRPLCQTCRAADPMTPERMADVPATLATFTVDRLAFSLDPPVVAGVLDFDGGGRYQCEITDVVPDRVAIGDRFEMTFRRMSTTGNGIHNYFWKARPAAPGGKV